MLEQEIKIPASPVASYRIKIGTDILGSLWPHIEADFGKYSKFIVTDENLAPRFTRGFFYGAPLNQDTPQR